MLEKNIPCFAFEDKFDDLFNVTMKASSDIGLIPIDNKDLDEDLNNIIQRVHDSLLKHGLRINQQVMYEDYYWLRTILHHPISFEYYEYNIV